ncbi:hypothetical protein BC828DRAFT_377740 [Blastocladiella britannica]|nr:hypothetical protein BC828DRAFT_377740 [Blastocladiella britannica]
MATAIARDSNKKPTPPLADPVQLAHTLCFRLLTEGHVAAFAEAVKLLGLTPSATNSSNMVSAGTEARGSAVTGAIASPTAVQRLCVLLAAREDALQRVPASAMVMASPAVLQTTRAIALFLLDLLPESAFEYARRTLMIASALATPPALPVTGKPGTPLDPAVVLGICETFTSDDARSAVIDAHLLVGDTCAAVGKYEEGIMHYKKALIVPEAVERLVQTSVLFAQQQLHAGHQAAAAATYKSALMCIPPLHPRAAPLEMRLRRRLGLVFLSLDELASAESQLVQFLSWAQLPANMQYILPSSSKKATPSAGSNENKDPIGTASLALAQVRERGGDLTGASQVLQGYLDLRGKDPRCAERASVMLGNLWNRLDQAGKAADLLRDAKDDSAACQLGIARGTAVWSDFLAAVNSTPQDYYKLTDKLRKQFRACP